MADNINISPEMINNIMNMLKNSQSTNDSNVTSNSNSNTEQNNTENNQDNDNTSIDFETILKIKSMMETLNTKNDPRSNLLYSLKPYLRSSKQSKVDQYVNLLKITQVSELFKNEKGESH